MPPVAAHLALGAAAAVLVARSLPARVDRRAAGLGLVAGAVLPDASLLVAAPVVLATGDVALGAAVHGSLTHFLLLAGAVAAAGVILLRAGRRAWGVGAVAFAAGAAVLHALPDAFYLEGVPLLFPLVTDAYHWGPVHADALDAGTLNVIRGAGFAAESLAWVYASWIAAAYDVDNKFTRALPALAFLNLVVFIGVTTTYAGTLDADAFLRLAYAPGVLTTLVSAVLVPALARDAWQALGDAPVTRFHAS